MIYFGLIFLAFFQYFIIVGKNNTLINRKLYLLITGIEIFLFLGFRSANIGHDSWGYADFFKIVRDSPLSPDTYPWMEFSFVIFTKFLTFFSSHPQILFLSTSAFIVYATIRLINKYTTMPWLAIFVYLTFGKIMFEAGGIRQSLSIAISFFAFDFIIKRNFLKFFLLIALASLMHTSSWLLLIMYPLSFIKPTAKNISFFAIFIISIFFIAPFISKIAFAIMPYYSGYETNALKSDIKLGSIVKVAISLTICLLGWLTLRIKISKDKNFIATEQGKQYIVLFIFSIIAVGFYILSIQIRLFERLAFYFDFFNIIFIPQIFTVLNISKFKNIILISLILLTISYQGILIKYRPDWNMYIPYEPFWDNLDCIRTDVFLDKMEYLARR